MCLASRWRATSRTLFYPMRTQVVRPRPDVYKTNQCTDPCCTQVLGSEAARTTFQSSYVEHRGSTILSGVPKRFVVVELLNCSADETGVVVAYRVECEYSLGTRLNMLDASAETCESILLRVEAQLSRSSRPAASGRGDVDGAGSRSRRQAAVTSGGASQALTCLHT